MDTGATTRASSNRFCTRQMPARTWPLARSWFSTSPTTAQSLSAPRSNTKPAPGTNSSSAAPSRPSCRRFGRPRMYCPPHWRNGRPSSCNASGPRNWGRSACRLRARPVSQASSGPSPSRPAHGRRTGGPSQSSPSRPCASPNYSMKKAFRRPASALLALRPDRAKSCSSRWPRAEASRSATR